jgi:DNA-binding IscR family transcriptional regulator
MQALAYLIRSHARDEWGQIGDIARDCDIPRKYLEQVLLELKSAGLVQSKKGQHGGYRLSRPPHEISLGQAISAIQGEWCRFPIGSTTAPPIFHRLRFTRCGGTSTQPGAKVFDATSIEVLVCAYGWLARGIEMV